MKYYPIYLDIKDKNILVVGGGGVSLRKVKRLLASGGIVKAVSLNFCDGFSEILNNSNFTCETRKFEESDLNDIFLVFSATNDAGLNDLVGSLAKSKGILCNIADSSESSDFIVPSSINRGDLVLSVSTGGKSPAFSRKLRKDLEDQFGEEYEIFLYFLGKIREAVLEIQRGSVGNQDIFRSLVFGKLLEFIKIRDIKGIETELRENLQDEYLSQKLMDTLLSSKHDYFFNVEDTQSLDLTREN